VGAHSAKRSANAVTEDDLPPNWRSRGFQDQLACQCAAAYDDVLEGILDLLESLAQEWLEEAFGRWRFLRERQHGFVA
jgi:hypothetical protein